LGSNDFKLFHGFSLEERNSQPDSPFHHVHKGFESAGCPVNGRYLIIKSSNSARFYEQVRLVVRPKKLRLIDFLMGRRLPGLKLFLALRQEEMLSTLELLDRDKILVIMPLWIKPE
jgi:hypothetical protein